MADYVAKFEELSRFFSHYNGEDTESFKCLKFESMHPKIKQLIRYQEILCFSVGQQVQDLR